MLIRSVFGSGRNRNNTQQQQPVQQQRIDPLDSLKYYDLGAPGHRQTNQGGYVQPQQPEVYSQPQEQYRSTVSFGNGNDGSTSK
jgi:hypothetical protein